MKIEIKRISLLNFKGIKDITIDFDGVSTIISGDNGTGKTTIFDAFTWCLFGKDHLDRTDSGRGSFGIKSTDAKGNIMEKLDHSVECVMNVNGNDVIYCRILKENWVTKRGSKELVMSGNSTHYYIDGLEVKACEYSESIFKLIDSDLFKMLSNPRYFCSLPWEERRRMLCGIIGQVTYQEAATTSDLRQLLDELEDKDVVLHKKYVQQQIKKINAEMAECPIRVDAITRVTPEALDWGALESEKRAKEAAIKACDEFLADITAASKNHFNKNRERLTEINNLRDQQRELFEKAKSDRFSDYLNFVSERRKKQDEFFAQENERKRTIDKIAQKKVEIENLQIKISKTRDKWVAKSEEEYKADYSTPLMCPCMGLECRDERIIANAEQARKKAEEKFYEDRSKALDALSAEGKSLSSLIEENNKNLSDLEKSERSERLLLDNLKTPMEEINKPEDVDAMTVPGYADLQAKIDVVQGLITDFVADDDKIKEDRKEAVKELDAIKQSLLVRSEIEKNNKEIDAVLLREKELGGQKASLEKDDMLTDKLICSYISLIEERVNKMFTTVRFRMFDKQLNGEIIPDCTAYIDGVRYEDKNNAGQINAGIEIINVLSEHYNTFVPVFIDNAESINRIEPVHSQAILLVVSREEKLTIK